jgi:CelD/BcsL family acetyltransferase involved in cellulose biosynthesis
MKFSLISGTEIDSSLYLDWLKLCEARVHYHSPYFHPAFTKAISAARADTRILVCESDNAVVGILPFHRLNRFAARPIGIYLSDYHGTILHPDHTIAANDLLKAMRVPYFSFDHIPAQISEFSQYSWQHSRSPQLDLQGGYEAYRVRLAQFQNVKEAGVLKTAQQSMRRLEREIGPLRFVMHSHDKQDFQALLDGKSAQFIRTVGSQSDIFAIPWIRQVMDELRDTDGDDFGGMLSTLHAGDKLIAAHFGMRYGNVLHYWFPWYDTDYAQFSTGIVLLRECARAAEQHGITLIDLGRGEQAYKMRFATGSQALLEGAISRPACIRTLQMIARRQKDTLKNSALGNHLRNLKKMLRV